MFTHEEGWCHESTDGFHHQAADQKSAHWKQGDKIWTRLQYLEEVESKNDLNIWIKEKGSKRLTNYKFLEYTLLDLFH